ncbi:MAG: PIN domain nuclease [bacterium]|nr:PIN domain nuclease [bacterium]
MMIVDSNTWADFFNGRDTPHVQRLDEALDDEQDLAVLPIIVTEVLQGFRSDTEFRRARRVFESLPAIDTGVDGHVRAAELFRRLRRKGITVRGAVDCVIAQACLDADAELLSPDRDFERIARHTRLRLWKP